MPRLDGTGPQGQGPKTGKGMGKCGERVGYGGGYGRGCCGGYMGRMFYTREEKNELLKDRKEELENELKAVKEELDQN